MAKRGDAASFVARIWLESGPNGNPRWRGHLQHVQSQRGGFFEDLSALQGLVESISGIAGPVMEPRRRAVTRALTVTRSARAKPRKKRNG
ncbi:MAG: hypothetical protein IT536_05810 [Hyphomicrobiales bacterium]|nr:hypothetical protein [Hyphomicrobiales bacterium]